MTLSINLGGDGLRRLTAKRYNDSIKKDKRNVRVICVIMLSL